MKTYETKSRTVTEEHLIETKCDLCGRISTQSDYEHPWAKDSVDAVCTEVKITTGATWGQDGGDHTERSFDICPECFETKLSRMFACKPPSLP